jgi:ankyrin repeat protein
VQRGGTALLRAARDARTDCLRLLVEAGADKNAKDDVRVVPVFSVVYLLAQFENVSFS